MFVGSANNRAGGCGLSKAALFLFLFLIVRTLFSMPGDSLKNKYDINDPRNPNCPCHKYQQQAENEYRQMQGNNVSFTSSDESGIHGLAGSSSEKNHASSIHFFRRKKITGRIYKWRSMFWNEYRLKWKSPGKVNRCFDWS